MSKKKIVYITSDMGAGHNSAVKALTEAIEKYYPGQFDHQPVDVIGLIGSNIDKIAENIYKSMVTYSKVSYKAFYNFTNKSEIWSFVDRSGYTLIRPYLKTIAKEKPDLVVSCFPFLSYSLSKYIKEKKMGAPFVSLITDTGDVHSFWHCEMIDYLFVPTEDTGFHMVEGGIDKEKVKVFGFPVIQEFYRQYDKSELLKKYDIDPGKKIITYLSGAWGVGKNEEKIRELDNALNNVAIMVVCGKNKKMVDKLSQNSYKNDVHILGFVDSVAEVLSMADLVVSKAGGISIMEIITMKKPVIVTEIVPGQEEPNARFIESMGFGYVEKKPEDMAKRAKYILETDDLERLNRNYSEYHLNEDSDKKIADFMVGLLKKNIRHDEKKEKQAAATKN